jgi:hypothetical protein
VGQTRSAAHIKRRSLKARSFNLINKDGGILPDILPSPRSMPVVNRLFRCSFPRLFGS